MELINIGWSEVEQRAQKIAEEIDLLTSSCPVQLYGIPRGGVFAALAVMAYVKGGAVLVEKPGDDCVFIDDVLDTRRTRNEYSGLPFFALVDKFDEDNHLQGKWISFPWERMTHDEGPVENVRRLIEYIGEDPEREGLKETPERVIRSYEKLFGGYKEKPGDVIKVFEDDTCDEIVLIRDVEFYSTCEHHMLPFFGKAHIAYIPKGRVIGVSKLVRILEVYARRLQIQERLCQQVTEVIDNMIQPSGAACVLEAQHFCMTARGVEKQGSIMVTASLTG